MLGVPAEVEQDLGLRRGHDPGRARGVEQVGLVPGRSGGLGAAPAGDRVHLVPSSDEPSQRLAAHEPGGPGQEDPAHAAKSG